MTYTLLPETLRGCLLVLATFILIIYMYCFIRMLDLGREKSYIIITGCLMITAFILYQGMIMYQQGDRESLDIPVVMLILIFLLFLIFCVMMQRNIIKWQNENISGMSVKEAFDRLPSGLLFYTFNGTPVMINKTMQQISHELFGASVVDACYYWEQIIRNRDEEILYDDNTAIVRHDSGSVYSFKRDIYEVNGVKVYEVIATDISSEYSLSRELEEKRNRARILNSRLKALMGTIEYVTMNRELLQLKIALHDNIGQSILIAKRYLYSPNSVDADRMLEFWQDNMRHLVSDEPEEWELPYYVISKEADRLGVKLNILGELPKEQELIQIVDEAISVHIGNTLKHSDSDEITVAVSETDDRYRIRFGNNDSRAVGEVTEKGGLKNLRSEVERVGGTMEISTESGFELVIGLPKKRGIEIWHTE